MRPWKRWCHAFTILALASGALSAESKSTSKSGPVAAADDGEKIAVTIDGAPFAELRYKGYPKPIIYPIVGPGGAGMVRHFPMKDGVEGEARDHPHHQSLWYTHGSVNGVDFWSLGKGSIVCTSAKLADLRAATTAAGETHSVGARLENEWRDRDGKVVLTDEQSIDFVLLPGGDRAIDYTITFKASHGDVTFGDTKEGSAGIRTHPKLNIDRGAKAINSEGQEGKGIWGKRARWVDYSAEVEGKPVGVAIFDHPSNPRHPTWWHAREYGLVAANPFGIHDFERKEKGAGDFKIDNGKSATFRYRFLFHAGDAAKADVGGRYTAWAK